MRVVAHGLSWEALSPSYYRQPDKMAEVFYGGADYGWRINAIGGRVYPNLPFESRDVAMRYVATYGGAR